MSIELSRIFNCLPACHGHDMWLVHIHHTFYDILTHPMIFSPTGHTALPWPVVRLDRLFHHRGRQGSSGAVASRSACNPEQQGPGRGHMLPGRLDYDPRCRMAHSPRHNLGMRGRVCATGPSHQHQQLWLAGHSEGHRQYLCVGGSLLASNSHLRHGYKHV